jgi:hypothetical protein
MPGQPQPLLYPPLEILEVEANKLASYLQKMTNEKAIHYRRRAESMQALQRLEYEAKTISEAPRTKETQRVCGSTMGV